jgi:hypothetical protein
MAYIVSMCLLWRFRFLWLVRIMSVSSAIARFAKNFHVRNTDCFAFSALTCERRRPHATARALSVLAEAHASRTGGESRLGYSSIEFRQRIHGSLPNLRAFGVAGLGLNAARADGGTSISPLMS